MKSQDFSRCLLGIFTAFLLGGCGAATSMVPQVTQEDAYGYSDSIRDHLKNSSDGAGPTGGVIFDNKGALNGTTSGGGSGGWGTVFKLALSGSGYSERVIHNFTGPDGAAPYAGVMTPSGSRYDESILHNFENNPDGAYPYGGLIFDTTGALYDDPYLGWGTVFKLTPSGARYSESLLHAFTGRRDGGHPNAGLIFDKKGALYGTTTGGYYGGGNAFKLRPSRLKYSLRVLDRFPGSSGDGPLGGLIFGAAGALYGTTGSGGMYGSGTVFELTRSGSGYAVRTLYSFKGGTDGASPSGSGYTESVLYAFRGGGGKGLLR